MRSGDGGLAGSDGEGEEIDRLDIEFLVEIKDADLPEILVTVIRPAELLCQLAVVVEAVARRAGEESGRTQVSDIEVEHAAINVGRLEVRDRVPTRD